MKGKNQKIDSATQKVITNPQLFQFIFSHPEELKQAAPKEHSVNYLVDLEKVGQQLKNLTLDKKHFDGMKEILELCFSSDLGMEARAITPEALKKLTQYLTKHKHFCIAINNMDDQKLKLYAQYIMLIQCEKNQTTHAAVQKIVDNFRLFQFVFSDPEELKRIVGSEHGTDYMDRLAEAGQQLHALVLDEKHFKDLKKILEICFGSKSTMEGTTGTPEEIAKRLTDYLLKHKSVRESINGLDDVTLRWYAEYIGFTWLPIMKPFLEGRLQLHRSAVNKKDDYEIIAGIDRGKENKDPAPNYQATPEFPRENPPIKAGKEEIDDDNKTTERTKSFLKSTSYAERQKAYPSQIKIEMPGSNKPTEDKPKAPVGNNHTTKPKR